ncbi:glycosyltransferase [Acetobacter sp. TBRC 12305]|uniref:Glycosyltransferase n=1 Tax=Acetobacter garciniae TaxID=2817435 RepID=A0A939HMU6_9PROT|nr:glycosyltransferase [Acetobacter garciniae]MBO1323821.1 glycosyltransferase [Acetobacter garciniae]MBX0343510.1 glycosyltransferase [Acetobacter garciniae]
MAQQIAALLVTYNRLEKLKVSLAATLAQDFCRVIVVDNASQDGTASWLDQLEDRRLTVLKAGVNLGGAGGFAHGLAYARDLEGVDWIACFDDDAWPEADALAQFRQIEAGGTVGLIAAAVYLPGGQIPQMNRPGLSPFDDWKSFWSFLKNKKRSFGLDDAAYRGTEIKEISYSSFVGAFLKRSMLKETGLLPDCRMFIYCDDTLFTFLCHQAGYGSFFAPLVKFQHDVAARPFTTQVHWRLYYLIRNQMIFYRYFSGRFFCLFQIVLVLKILLAHARFLRQKNGARLVMSALCDGYRLDLSKSHADILLLCGN